MCVKGQGASTSPGKPETARVLQIDAVRLKQLVKPSGKPLLVNFWATWCDPCREEFPDLVKIDEKYRGRIDFITVTMDDLSDINTAVPQFLLEMKAQMPSYLLKTPDEDAAISGIASGWRGGLPFTLLYRPDGSISYFRQGKVSPIVLSAEIDKLVTAPTAETP
jgi:thiol-disulfide isomerase/thioredoxin